MSLFHYMTKPKSFSKKVTVTEEEAKSLHKKFKRAYPGIAAWRKRLLSRIK